MTATLRRQWARVRSRTLVVACSDGRLQEATDALTAVLFNLDHDEGSEPRGSCDIIGVQRAHVAAARRAYIDPLLPAHKDVRGREGTYKVSQQHTLNVGEQPEYPKFCVVTYKITKKTMKIQKIALCFSPYYSIHEAGRTRKGGLSVAP